ncbi:MAG: polyprenyl diphosphate synthase [Deltaproteobacteria bacterium]|nr:polyprenyl diphosphate synthase [Deltaproteobacteria bacterium]
MRRLKDLLGMPFYALYRRRLEMQSKNWQIPRHIGIIMDGNRRFARDLHFQDVNLGHARGADKLEEVLNWCEELEVKVVSVWVFSLDNFKRDPSEVDGLMELFERKFLELVTHPRIHQQQIRVRSLGRTDVLPARVQEAIRVAEEATRHYTRRHLNVVVAYGGREEIIDAFRQYLQEGLRKKQSLERIIEDLEPGSIEGYLYTSQLPDPDLIIRTSGEIRLSGFLLWQSVYSELYFCDSNWPAFRKIDFLRALRNYNNRQRRFGK